MIAFNEVLSFEDFPYTYNLGQGEKILLQDSNACGFRIIDSLLIVKNFNDTNAYQLYNLKTLDLLGKFMNIGHGTNELTTIPDIHDIFPYKTDSIYLISFADYGKGVYYDVNLVESSAKGKVIGTKNKIPQEKNSYTPFLFYHFTSDDFYIVKINIEKRQWIRSYYKDGKFIAVKPMEHLNNHAADNIE